MSKSILLADDSVTIQKVVELTFLEEDYEIITVGDGDEALARFAEAQPDLVIADVHMPGADGYEVCRQVKAQAPQLPVLLLVGTFEPFDAAEAQNCGADRHLKKPFESRDLQRQVEELMRGAAASTPAPEVAPTAPTPEPGGPISDEDVERIARRVAEILGDRAVRDVAWEVIPDLAEVVIKDRLRELEGQVD